MANQALVGTRRAKAESAVKRLLAEFQGRPEDQRWLRGQLEMLKHFPRSNRAPLLDAASVRKIKRLERLLREAGTVLQRWGDPATEDWLCVLPLVRNKPNCLKTLAADCDAAATFFRSLPGQLQDGWRRTDAAMERALWLARGIAERLDRPHFGDVAAMCNALCPGARFTADGLKSEASRRPGNKRNRD